MKTPKPYRVKSAYGMYRKGDIIFPTGMHRDELIMCGRIEAVPLPAAPEPEPIDDISNDVLVETATLDREVDLVHSAFLEPQPEPRRRGRHGR